MAVKLKKGIFFFTALGVGGFLFSAGLVQALGISPPWVINHELLRGSHFEKVVYINQGSPKEPLQAAVEVKASGFRDWLTIKPGLDFVIPKEQLFPVIIIVDVPPDAPLASYTGEIKIITSPLAGEGSAGQVAIGLGVAISLDLKVVEKEIINYTIPLWKVRPSEAGQPVQIAFTIENKGNVKAGPKRITLDVFDENKGVKIDSAEGSPLILVEPYQRKETIVSFPVELKAGNYWARIKLNKEKDEVIEYETLFQVFSKGSLPKLSKGLVFWLLVGLVLTSFLAVLFIWRGKLISFSQAIVGFFPRPGRKKRQSEQIEEEKE